MDRQGECTAGTPPLTRSRSILASVHPPTPQSGALDLHGNRGISQLCSFYAVFLCALHSACLRHSEINEKY